MRRVHYIELRGEGARAALGALLEQLPAQPGCLGAELLSSPEQPGLYLLASRWSGPLPALQLPRGAQAWSFVVEANFPSD